ncbi:tRNA lysidine(34) synthetase TilS, partial [Komagataeibacter sp. AV436]|nr:tRNA lysidine(34) synthetase TilS [Komagataeibacter melomenusus]
GRGRSCWPARLLRTLPALWHDGQVKAVPHMGLHAREPFATHAVFMNQPPHPVLDCAVFGGAGRDQPGRLA